MGLISKVADVQDLVAQGRANPGAVFAEIKKLAASDQWQTREVAATALVEIGKRHPEAVVREVTRWAKATDSNLRRAASEGLRGVVKLDPQAVRPVLELLRADAELYVKKSVANLLRNASVKQPEFVLALCREWARHDNAHTRWIVKDGLKKLRISRPREVAAILERRTEQAAAKPTRVRSTAKPKLLSGGNPQIAKAEGREPVQAYIAAAPGWKRDVARRIDALIVQTVPDVKQAVKWNSPFYGIEGRGWFMAFHIFTGFVKVTFFKGTSLRPAPLGGKSEEARWIDVRQDDLDEAQLTKWIRQAAALPGWGKS